MRIVIGKLPSYEIQHHTKVWHSVQWKTKYPSSPRLFKSYGKEPRNQTWRSHFNFSEVGEVSLTHAHRRTNKKSLNIRLLRARVTRYGDKSDFPLPFALFLLVCKLVRAYTIVNKQPVSPFFQATLPRSCQPFPSCWNRTRQFHYLFIRVNSPVGHLRVQTKAKKKAFGL